MMRHILQGTAVLVSLAFPVDASSVSCEGSNITVDAPERSPVRYDL